MSGLILAIETTQRKGGVAAFAPPDRVDVEWLSTSRRHDDDLVPALDRLVARMGRPPLAAVGVSIGPGGFTGLRIAIACVKTMAFARKIPVVGVPTALVVAETLPAGIAGPVLVLLASKRETVWSTRLERGETGWTITGGGALHDADTLELDGIRTAVGDAYLPDAVRTRLDHVGCPVVEPTFDPAACLDITRRWLADDRTTDPHRLAPIYPRPPEAVTKWQALHRPPTA